MGSYLEKFNGGKGFQGVDDNLPILNYAIIKSKPFQLYSNTKYIELFSGHKCNQLELKYQIGKGQFSRVSKIINNYFCFYK